jgi:hypothetical protein
MTGETCVYLGLVLVAAGLGSLVRPLRFLGIPSRRRAAAVLASGVALTVLGASLPATEVRIATPRTRLDEFAPAYQFVEAHSTRVRADPRRAYAAVRAVTADEILLLRTLTSIRRLGRRLPEGILNAPGRRPLLDVATSTGFLLLAEEKDREIVVGTLVLVPPGFRGRAHPTPDDFKRLHRPGFAKATMSFRVEPEGPDSTRVSTETRVFATDDASRRRFAAYWRLIHPGSALIRRMWLRAIRLRAEAPLDGARPELPD